MSTTRQKFSSDEYFDRQQRAYNNKVKHGFNVTDFHKESRFIMKELVELMDAIEHNDVKNLIEELGDIVIFCYGMAEMAHGDLDAQIFKKMSINEKRIYERDERGDFVKIDSDEDIEQKATQTFEMFTNNFQIGDEEIEGIPVEGECKPVIE